MARLEANLVDARQGSGVDWSTLIRTVIDRYADRLELLDYILSTSSFNETDKQQKALSQIKVLLTPYLVSSSPRPERIYELCSIAHTKHIVSNLTPAEELILGSIRGTTKEICRVIVNMYVEGTVDEWKEDVKGLMKWLDWSVWSKCRSGCGFEEFEYIPTWPYYLYEKDPVSDIDRPEPRCIRRIEPYPDWDFPAPPPI